MKKAHVASSIFYKRILTASLGAVALALGLWLGVAFADSVALDDFEGGNLGGGTGWIGAWQASGDVEVVRRGNPQTGSWHMRLRGENAAAYRDLDLSGWDSPELTVWVKADDFDPGDFARLLAGPSGALTELRRWDNGDDDNEYHLYTLELSQLDTSGAFRIRFEAHMEDEDAVLYVDAVEVSTSQSETPPPEPATPETLPPLAAIALDGEFGDWEGHARIEDPQGDASKTRGDILNFYWGDNDDDETVYWMIERPAGQFLPVKYSVHLDMNDDGDFEDDVDRIVEVRYAPLSTTSLVLVLLRRADTNSVIHIDLESDWGDTWSEGGARVEFGMPFELLGFLFGSTFRMYVESGFNDRAPDSGDIQWSPVPILGYIGLGVALVAGGVAVWWFKLRRYEGREVPKT